MITRESELDAVAAEISSRRMFVARLENMQQNGDHWLTVVAVLALLNDCDMLVCSPPIATRKPEQTT